MNYYIKVLKDYAVFTGRARRSEYWYFALFTTLITFVFTIIGYFTKIIFLGNIYSFAVFIPSLAVGVRRMHDVDKSGWFLLIPIYNLILLFTEGTTGENQYGEDPKGGNLYGADDYEKPLDLNPDL